jgi:PEGA domain
VGGYALLSSGGSSSAEGPLAQTDSTLVAPTPPEPDTAIVIADGGDSAVIDSTPAPEPSPPAPTTATIALSGLGSGASVWIDGRRVQGTNHTVPPGRHQIRASRNGYEDYSATVEVSGGSTTRVPVQWQRLAAPEPRPPTPTPRSQCEQFGDTYNAAGDCFDSPPRPQEATLVPLPDDFEGTPRPLLLLVKISATGTVLQALPVLGSNASAVDRRFAGEAAKFALTLDYRPALKDGAPVEAWKQEQFLPAPRR